MRTPALLLGALLGTVLLLAPVQGGALDLASLVHRYEDQVLGRQVGQGAEEDQEPENIGTVGRPVEVHGWDSGLELGQVSAVDVNLSDDPVVFHRGPVSWDGNSFDREERLVARTGPAIQVDTILTLDANKGKVKSGFGKDMFYMPHGLNIDHEGNTWVTDVGLHQVMKFPAGETKPSLVLGERFIPGSDSNHFCKPTSTAVSSTGQVFVADGYCNSRVAVFDSAGKHLHDLAGDWTVVHSIVLYEQEDILCVVDREGKKVECIGAGLRAPQFRGQSSTVLPGLGRVFGIAGRGTALIAVNGRGSFYDPPVRGVTLDLASDNQLVDVWGEELQNPHDVTISRAGDAVYVAEIGPNRLRKFEVVTPAAEMF
jgi:peptidylamidoglycolate lyase